MRHNLLGHEMPASRPVGRLAQLIGVAALEAVLGLGVAVNSTPALWGQESTAEAFSNTAPASFGTLGTSQAYLIMRILNPDIAPTPNYLRSRDKIDQAVVAARDKKDPGSLRLVAWNDMAQLAGQMDNQVYKAKWIQDIVTTLVAYDYEKGRHASNRSGSIWASRPWDQTIVETVGGGNATTGKGICLDIALALMETSLRAGIVPSDAAVAIVDLVKNRPDDSSGTPDTLPHAVEILQAQGQALVLAQNGVFGRNQYFGQEVPGCAGRHAVATSAETISTVSSYMPGRLATMVPQPRPFDMGVSDHDAAIGKQISDRKLRLAQDLKAAGAIPLPKIVFLPSDIVCKPTPGNAPLFARP